MQPMKPWPPRDLLFQPEPTVWVQNFFGPGYQNWFRAVSELGSNWGVAFAVGLALWMWGRRDAYALVGIAIVSAVASVVMNQLFHVPRPSDPAVIKYEQIALGSFPSGHVFLATLLWGVLYVRGRISGWVLALVLVGVSVARLYLGVHYLTDVYGGAIFALTVVGIYHPLWSRAEGRLREWRFGVYAALGALVVVGAVAGYVAGFYGSNPFQWHSAGLALGGAVALLLEYRYIRYVPVPVGSWGIAGRLGLGLAGLVPLVVVDHAAGDEDYLLAAILVAVGALWAILILPLLLRRIEEEWSGSMAEPRPRTQGTHGPGYG